MIYEQTAKIMYFITEYFEKKGIAYEAPSFCEVNVHLYNGESVKLAIIISVDVFRKYVMLDFWIPGTIPDGQTLPMLSLINELNAGNYFGSYFQRGNRLYYRHTIYLNDSFSEDTFAFAYENAIETTELHSPELLEVYHSKIKVQHFEINLN